MSANQKIIAFVPAYNVEKTLEKTIEAVPRGSVDEIIVVDDGSRDNTWEVIKKLGVKAVRHQKNRGYGGVQKTGYRESLKNGADIVVMIHGDFQYDPKFTPDVVKPLVSENFDICIGSRMMDHKKALELGLPYWKLIGNIFLTAIENFILGLRLSEYHTGFRAYSRKFLEKVPFE